MSKQPQFGTYEAHQPNYEGFKQLSKLNDFTFQSLAHMGNASHHMAWANTVLEDVKEVPEELKADMKQINAEIHRIQERLREIRQGDVQTGEVTHYTAHPKVDEWTDDGHTWTWRKSYKASRNESGFWICSNEGQRFFNRDEWDLVDEKFILDEI